MRSMLLATTAAFGLAAFGALAQQEQATQPLPPAQNQQDATGAAGSDATITGETGSATPTDPAMTGQTGTTTGTGTDSTMTGQTDTTTGTGSDATMTGQTDTTTETDSTMTGQSEGTVTTTTTDSATDAASETTAGSEQADVTENTDQIVAGGQVYESYEEMGDGTAAIEGGFTAEELLDADVVNMEGESLGTIEDLAVGADGQVRHALIDVSGFFDVTSRYVLVDLAELQRGEGDSADEYVLNVSEEALDAMTSYERSEDNWTMQQRAE